MSPHPAFFLPAAQYGGGPGSGMNGFGTNWGGHMYMPFGGLFMIVLLVVCVGLVLLVLRNAAGRPPRDAAPSSLEMLKGRYARGEIDRETYLAIKADLEAKNDGK
ncbi:MAG: SHOCT domain-containing protein [Desulfovibrio sp.]